MRLFFRGFVFSFFEPVDHLINDFGRIKIAVGEIRRAGQPSLNHLWQVNVCAIGCVKFLCVKPGRQFLGYFLFQFSDCGKFLDFAS